MNTFQLKLKREAKYQLFLGILSLLALFMLNACGSSKDRNYNLNDREAPYLVSGKIDSNAEEVSVEEDEDSESAVRVTSPQYFRNVRVNADFDSPEKTVVLTADVQLPNGSYLPVRLNGRFKKEEQPAAASATQPASRASHYATLTDPAVPFLMVKAQCINDCDHIVLHTVIRESDTKFITNQFKTLNQRVVSGGITKQEEVTLSPTEVAPSASGTAVQPTTPVTPAAPAQDTADAQTEEAPASTISRSDSLNLPDVDDLVTSGRIGSFSKAQVSFSEITTLTTRQQFVRPIVPTIEDVKNTPVPPAPIIPTQPQATKKPEEIKREIEKLEIQGSGFVISESDAESDYPFELGPKYTGQAEGCYSGLRRVDNNGKVFVCQVGKLSFGNLIERTLFGVSVQAEDPYRWASGLMAKFIEKVAEKMKNTFDVDVAVGGIALQNGGVFAPHKSHQNGLDADIPMPRNGKKLDIEKTWEMIKIMYDQKYTENNEEKPLVQILIVNPSRKNDLCRVAKAKNEQNHLALRHLFYINSNGKPIENHDTHVHVRLECTPHNGCQEYRTKPATKSPCK